MKFVFIAPRFHTNFYYQVKILLDHGHQVDFLALYQGQSEDHNLVTPIILGLAGKRRPPFFSFLKQFWRSHPDAVVIKDIVTSYSLLALISALVWRKKIVIMTQIPKFRSKLKSRSVDFLWHLGRIYVLTPVLGDIRFTNNNHNLVYVPFVITPSHIITTGLNDKLLRILCVGKWQERKRQLLLIEAIEKIKDEFSVKLTLVGQEDELNYLLQVKNYIKDHKLENVVEIVPHRPWSQMADLYRQTDLFVLPSVDESAAYSILEAMSYGLPVISSDDNGTQGYIKEGLNGFIFRRDDLVDLTQKIKQIISNRQVMRQMGQVSSKLVESNHQPEVFYQALMAALN